ncbi:MAG: sigma-70 family RNA polymerase sigma factor, partial [Ilumatobacteraceae bacterium]
RGSVGGIGREAEHSDEAHGGGKVTTQQARTAESSPDYGDRNVELFRERKTLQEMLAQTEVSDPGESREVARLRRRLESITTEIVRFNTGLVRSYCRRFTSNSSRGDSEDFEAAGMLGLMRAIDSFDPDQGRFGHWAYKPIQREVLRAVRDADHPNLNLGDFERRPEILRAYRQLQGDDEHLIPSYEDVATVVGVTVDQVRRVLSPPRLESAQLPVGGDESTTLGDSVASGAAGPDEVVSSGMTLAALKHFGIAALDHRELYVIVRRMGLDGEPEEKLADIGETLGLSREAVRQIEAKAVAKMQHPMVLRRIQRLGRS